MAKTIPAPACTPAYRTVREPKADNAEPLLLLENNLDVQFLDMEAGLQGGIFTDSTLGLTCHGVIDFLKTSSFFHNPFKEKIPTPALRCKFLPPSTDKLIQLIWGDAYLNEALLTQFYLRILEKLLVWGEENKFATLMVIFDPETMEFLETYQEFAISRSKGQPLGMQETHCAIPISAKAINRVIKALHDHEKTLRQTLWHGQRYNPAFCHYLKRNPL